jgi:flagellar hook-associated protein 1 FlgK
VEALRVSQLRDSFLDARYRMQNAEDNKYEAVLAGLNDLENVIDQTMYTGLLDEIATFKNALDPMLQSPSSSDMAMVVRNAAQKVTSLLNTYATQVENVREQQIFDLQNVHIDNSFNSVVRNIAALNRQINEELAHGNTPNELFDERNLLFDKLSGLANVKITITPKKLSENLSVEHVQINMIDDVTGKSIDIVDDETFNTLTAAKNPDGTVRVEVNSAFGNIGLKDITQYVTGGTLGGTLDVINGKGTEFGSHANGDNTFRGTLYYKGMLDTFAANFARVLNDANRYNPNAYQPSEVRVSSPQLLDAAGVWQTNPDYDPAHADYDPELDSSHASFDQDKYDATALPVNEDRDLFATIDGAAVVTAANIRVSQEWFDDPMFLTVTQPGDLSPGENIGRLIVSITNPVDAYHKDGDTSRPSVFNNGTFEEFLTGLNATLGLDVSLYTNYSETSANVMTTLFTSRESVSGVNLEEEGTYLMAYQKSYNAAVRYFTVLDEAVNTIINNMGLVGR